MTVRAKTLEPLDLSRTYIRWTNLSQTNLAGTNFTDADCEGVNFRGSDFRDAVFLRTNLKGADFAGALNLTREQLARTIIDAHTILPDYLRAEGSRILESAK